MNSTTQGIDSYGFHAGVFYIISTLRKKGFDIVLSKSKVSLSDNEFITDIDDLINILKTNPDITFIGITLLESYFEKVEKLINFLTKKTNAFIAVGGVMPTLTPLHVFYHLKNVNFVIRGAGEIVLPEILTILNGQNRTTPLTVKQQRNLKKIKGIAFRQNKLIILDNIDDVNEIDEYDKYNLDFSFIEKNDIQDGLFLYTSRCCKNNCFFCTTPGKGKFVAKSIDNLKEILDSYYFRLKELFGKNIPSITLSLAFYDDDFLGDAQRSINFLRYIRCSPFYINFFQTGINSFFINNGKSKNKLNYELLDIISPDLFSHKKTHIYIGTENFSDAELERLGKGYNVEQVGQVIKELTKRKIYQRHHWIFSNVFTTLEDIAENLSKISQLKLKYSPYFNILFPFINYLGSFYPSISYAILKRKGLLRYLKIRKMLRIKGHPDLNYPLVNHDIPIDKKARYVAGHIDQILNSSNDDIEVLRKIKNKFLF